MRRLLSVLLIAVCVVAGIALWQKDRLRQYFYPTKLLIPYSQPPSIYDLLSILEKNGINVASSPTINGQTIEATISGVTVYFAQDKDFFTQVRSLQLVLPKIKMNEKSIKVIDLRFSKVVIR